MRDLLSGWAVVFDLDGTLIDSAPEIHAAALEVLAAESLPRLDFATVKGFIGRGVPDLIGRMLAHLGTPDPARQARMAAAFMGGYEGAVSVTTVSPDAAQALVTLAGQGAARRPAFAFADWADFPERLAAFSVRPGELPLAAPAPAL